MYTEIILDYYRSPRNFGSIQAADIRAADNNPLCGDEVEMSIRLEGDKVAGIKWRGKGCAISQAAAGMLTEMVEGKTIQELRILCKDDLLGQLGIELSAVRLKCALLGLKVLKMGIYGHLGGQIERKDDLSKGLVIA